MTLTEANVGRVSAAVYTGVALFGALVFFVAALVTGDYSWVSRIGGTFWVFLLALIILMPTVTPLLRARMSPAAAVAQAESARDPVCGMDVDPATAAGSSEYEGKTYYFCSPGCKKTFDESPEKYAG